MRHEKTYRPQKGRWPLPREKWPGCARLSRLLSAVLILMTVLCWQSCGTTRKSERDQIMKETVLELRDTAATVTREIRREEVPESRVELSIHVDSLLKLPSEATYTKHSGQAGAAVSRSGGVIYVTATCDSMQREVEYYSEELRRLQEKAERQEEREEIEKKTERGDIEYLLALSALAGFMSAHVMKKRKERKQDDSKDKKSGLG